MHNVTKIIANKDNTRVVMVASVPDDSLFPGAVVDVVATISLANGLKASDIVPTLKAEDFVIDNVTDGFGTAKRK